MFSTRSSKGIGLYTISWTSHTSPWTHWKSARIITELRQELPNHRVVNKQQQLSCQTARILHMSLQSSQPKSCSRALCDTSCKSQAKQEVKGLEMFINTARVLQRTNASLAKLTQAAIQNTTSTHPSCSTLKKNQPGKNEHNRKKEITSPHTDTADYMV